MRIVFLWFDIYKVKRRTFQTRAALSRKKASASYPTVPASSSVPRIPMDTICLQFFSHNAYPVGFPREVSCQRNTADPLPNGIRAESWQCYGGTVHITRGGITQWHNTICPYGTHCGRLLYSSRVSYTSHAICT